jgi:aryl-alcohol dehydrogenase-like predicted oxidoreductase
VAYAPLGRGLLTAKVEATAGLAETDTRRRHPRFAAANLAHNLELVHRIETIAQRKGCTPGQLAIAWLLAQGPDIIPIPGTKRKERLLENVGALAVKLDERDIAEISDAIPAGAAAGTRYPEAQMKGVFL